MTSRLLTEISFIRGGSYLFWSDKGKLDITPDTAEYFQWLEKLTSFHFKGRDGHFTARLEQKKPNETYWYAYRKAGKRQFKKYLGRTNRLTVARLEGIARQIQEEINQLPSQEKKKRKPLDQKERKGNLRARISGLETTVSEQKKRIQELEQEVSELKVTKAMEGYRRITREHKEE